MTLYRMDFESLSDAKNALAKLRELGYNKSYLDMVEKYNEEFSEEIDINIPRKTPDYSSAMLNSTKCKSSLEKSSLVAANPFVGGVGSLCELPGYRAASLFVNFEADKRDEVINILNNLRQ